MSITVLNLSILILLWCSISPDKVLSKKIKINSGEPIFDTIDNKSSQEALRGSPDQKKTNERKKKRKKKKSEPHAKKFDEKENNSAAFETPHQASGHEVQPEAMPTRICLAYLFVCMSIACCWSPFLSGELSSTICEPDQLVESPAPIDDQIDYAIFESWLEAPKFSEKSEPDAEKTDEKEKDPLATEPPDLASDLKVKPDVVPTPRSPSTNSHAETFIPIYPCLKEMILAEFGISQQVEEALEEVNVLGKDKADATEPPEPASDHKVKMESTSRPRSPAPTNPEPEKKKCHRPNCPVPKELKLAELSEFRRQEVKKKTIKEKADTIEPPEKASDQKVEMESKPRPRSPAPTKPELEKSPGQKKLNLAEFRRKEINKVPVKEKADAMEPPEPDSDQKVEMESTPRPRSPVPTNPEPEKKNCHSPNCPGLNKVSGNENNTKDQVQEQSENIPSKNQIIKRKITLKVLHHPLKPSTLPQKDCYLTLQVYNRAGESKKIEGESKKIQIPRSSENQEWWTSPSLFFDYDNQYDAICITLKERKKTIVSKSKTKDFWTFNPALYTDKEKYRILGNNMPDFEGMIEIYAEKVVIEDKKKLQPSLKDRFASWRCSGEKKL